MTKQAPAGVAADAFDGARVVVVGGGNRLGARVYERLVDAGALVDVVDEPVEKPLAAVSLPSVFERVGRDYPAVVGPDAVSFGQRCAAADFVVLLGSATGAELDGTGVGDEAIALCETVLAAVDPGRCRAVCVLSTAMVYGARPSLPIPLSEDVEPGPNLRGRVAQRLQRAQMARDWGGQHGVAVSEIRPCLVASVELRSWVGRSVFGSRRVLPHERPPLQFVHIDDVAGAIMQCLALQLAGPFNVAPTGWLDEQAMVALADIRLVVRVGETTLQRWYQLKRWLRPASVPAELGEFSLHAWVVSSDRLGATGWRPLHTNEESFLVCHRVGWWSAQTARRRQDVALGATGLALGAVGFVVARAIRAAITQAFRVFRRAV